MGAVRRAPAAVLVIVLGLLPIQAWLRAGRPDVTYWNELDGLGGITWAATVSPEGELSVRVEYELSDERRDIYIQLPSGARFLHADGTPIPSTSGRYANVQSSGNFVVEYERAGAVTRYNDGVIVDFAGIGGSQDELFGCARCYLGLEGYGNTSLTGALFADDLTDARLAIGGVDQVRSGVDDGAVRFVGVLPGADQGAMIAWLPLAAAPDAPTRPGVPDAIIGETAAQVWEATLEASDGSLVEPDSGPPIGRIAGAVVLTAMWLALAGWILWRMVATARVLASDRPDDPGDRDAEFSPPSKLAPALVGVVVGDAGRGDRSAVASTLLALAHRGVIEIDGIDSERYRLTIPVGAKGGTKFEEAVLTELRPQGQLSSTATLTGPPLWGTGSAAFARQFDRLATATAREERLLRVTLTAWVLVPASVAMGIVALIASGGSSWLAWLITFAGPVVALAATLLTGVSLTAKGRAEREQWLQYGAWLRENSQLAQVGAPGIATWGQPLVYAAVLGAAPKAAAALGPD